MLLKLGVTTEILSAFDILHLLLQGPEKQVKSDRTPGLKGVYNDPGCGENASRVRARGGIGRREGVRNSKTALLGGFFTLLQECF